MPNNPHLNFLQHSGDAVRLVWRRIRRAIVVVLVLFACVGIAWLGHFFYVRTLIDQLAPWAQILVNAVYLMGSLAIAVWISNPCCVFQSQWRKEE